MAIARQSLTVGTTIIGTTLTLSVTVSAGSDLLLLVPVHVEANTDDATGITFNSVALTKLAEVEAAGGFGRVELWYLKNPTVTTANVVASFPSGSHKNLEAAVYTGVDQTTTFRTAQTTSGSSTSSGTLTVPSVASGDYVADFLTIDSTGHNATGGSHPNQTIEYDTNLTGADMVHSSQAGSDGGAMSHTWTTSGPFAYIATALIPAGGGTNVDITGVVAAATASGPVAMVSTLTRPYVLTTIA